MAISWEAKITNVNVVAKRADVTFTRTDSESTLAPQVYRFSNTIVAGADATETYNIRMALLETVKAKVEEDAEKEINIAAMITNLEQTAKSMLEAWEATR